MEFKMKKQDEQKHFLSLMRKVGDYAFIDISKLDIANHFYPHSLSDIDSFTMHFTNNEIIASIKRSNLVSDEYLSGKLVIADNQKHNPLEVIDKNFYGDFRIDLCLDKCIKNKEMLNNILNKFCSICKDKNISDSFKNSLKNNDLDDSIDILFNLPYLVLRKYIIYLIKNVL